MLTPAQKKLIHQQITDRGWTIREAAQAAGVSCAGLYKSLDTKKRYGLSTTTLNKLLPALGLTMHIHKPGAKP